MSQDDDTTTASVLVDRALIDSVGESVFVEMVERDLAVALDDVFRKIGDEMAERMMRGSGTGRPNGFLNQ